MADIDDLQLARTELDQAIYNHDQWHRELSRVLICRLPYDQRDVAADAHRQCRFGQWYYNSGRNHLHGHPAFVAVEAEHEHVHRLAARLLTASAHETAIPPFEYDSFANTVDRLRLQLQELRHEIEDSLFNRDSLTGAESRIGMLGRLRDQRELVRRRVQQCCIAVMDLDHFKAINDTFGHLVGDQVLAGVVRHAKGHLRTYDRIFRYGGEEFLVVLTGTALQAGHDIMDRLREGLAEAVVTTAKGQAVRVTASCGLTLIDPDASVEDSIGRADSALYAAKAAGRNCVRLWDPGLDRQATDAAP